MPQPTPGRGKKRTHQKILESKRSGEKMIYMSVPDYTSARWAEMAGVDVAVAGYSLSVIAHGHASTFAATMTMNSPASHRGASNTFLLACLPGQSYNTFERALSAAPWPTPRDSCRMVKAMQ